MNNYYFNIKSGEVIFPISILLLEKLASENKNIIVFREEECMVLSPAEYWTFNEEDIEEDYYYKIIKFEFKNNCKIFTNFELKLLSKFHSFYLNNTEFINYILSDEFLEVLKKVNSLRQTSLITPDKSKMFEMYKVPCSKVEYITLDKGNQMSIWNKLINLTNNCIWRI